MVNINDGLTWCCRRMRQARYKFQRPCSLNVWWCSDVCTSDVAPLNTALVNANQSADSMIPFYVMLASILIARGVGALGWQYLDDWQPATRAGLAVMFVFTDVAHFNRTRPDLVRMVPPQFPNPSALVTLTGIAELAGAFGLLLPSLARWAAYGLILLLMAMFPANIYAARTKYIIAGRPHTPLGIRLPLQLFWIALLWWSAR